MQAAANDAARLTAAERDGVVAALAQMAAGPGHDWAARALLQRLVGPEGERPDWLIGRGRRDEALAELRTLLAAEG